MLQWWGPDAGPTLRAEADVRPGGRFSIVFRLLNGDEHNPTGVFKEVIPDTKLVFTWEWPGMPERESLVTFLLQQIEGGTRLTLIHEHLPDEDARKSHEDGWCGLLDKLPVFLGEARLRGAARELQNLTGAHVTAITADHGSEEGRRRLFSDCPEPDIVVITFAPPGLTDDYRKIAIAEWREILDAVVVGSIELMRHYSDGMAKRRYGRIVNIATIAAKYPLAARTLSGTSRAAVANYAAGLVPGQEIAGTVVCAGKGVGSDWEIGQRVLGWCFGGGLADYIVLSADEVAAIPDNMSFAQAAAFRINYLTALHALRDRAGLRPGERLLVLGAAGGVGAAAIQVGKILGADIIAAASTAEKRNFARSIGADFVIETDVEGWRERLKSLCNGQGPAIILDPVCGHLFEPAFRSLIWGGRHLVVGFAGGNIPALPSNLTLLKGAALIGVDVRQFGLFETELAASHLCELLGWVRDEKIVPTVGQVFRFDDFASAFTYALSGKAIGKTVITLGD